MALTRGVLGIKVFSKQGVFPGETPEGAGLLVSHLPALLKRMLGSGARLPRTMFSDRGPGFFHRKWGTITGDYESACRECGFKPWAGTNSKKGPAISLVRLAMCSSTRQRFPGCAERKRRPALAHRGGRHRWSWNIACSQLFGTSTKNLMFAASRCNFPGRLRTLVVTDGDQLRT